MVRGLLIEITIPETEELQIQIIMEDRKISWGN